jgi:hypothetical protein
MLATFERVLGAALIVVILLDVFLTVLHARMGTGFLSRRVARVLWVLFRLVSRRLGRRRGLALSFCGPAILLSVLAIWALALTVGAALIILPGLGTAIRTSGGETSRDFMTALVAGGSSMSIVGVGDFSPHTGGYKLLYLCLSLLGLTVTSLTLMYLMQVYNALQLRNALGLRMYLLSAETNDAAELVAGLGPEGEFSSGYGVLAQLASDMAVLEEAHHFYPMLFYFRFEESYYSVSQFTLLAMDSVSLIRSALDEERLSWLQKSGGTTQLWRASMILARSLEKNFLNVEEMATMPLDSRTAERWRRRYEAALQRLQQANVPTTRDPRAGFEVYKTLRSEWDIHIAYLAPAMAYELAEIDPMCAETQPSECESPYTARRRAAGRVRLLRRPFV